MTEVYMYRVFNVLVGIIGLAIGVGLILVPKTISAIEKKLDKEFSTQKLEKILNERRNLSEVLMRRPKIFAAILILVSFFLILSSFTAF